MLNEIFTYDRVNDIYSKEERVVGRWIDGKPIYQKTYVDLEAKSTASGTATYTYYDISDLNIDRVVSLHSAIKYATNTLTGMVTQSWVDGHSIAYDHANNGNRMETAVIYPNGASSNPGKLNLINSLGYSTYFTVTIRYTKTTG